MTVATPSRPAIHSSRIAPFVEFHNENASFAAKSCENAYSLGKCIVFRSIYPLPRGEPFAERWIVAATAPPGSASVPRRSPSRSQKRTSSAEVTMSCADLGCITTDSQAGTLKLSTFSSNFFKCTKRRTDFHKMFRTCSEELQQNCSTTAW